ncbi:MAG: chemotaxis protein CheB [Rhodospirillales bacterium]
MPRTYISSNSESEDPEDNYLIVGIGASAGGLDAFRKFLEAMPAKSGMAFILVQHLDPSHESMVAELLSSHTTMNVHQAVEGTPVKPNCVYVIPPGTSLEIINGLFHMSAPLTVHGARLPFDFLLRSLAERIGERAVAVVLSGTGADGSVGIRAIHKNRGFIIAQEPCEAGYDGMPQSAIDTGLVDRVLPVSEIPDSLISYSRWLKRETLSSPDERVLPVDKPDHLTEIIEFLRANSVYDFTRYKRGTLERRIERRMSMSDIGSEGLGRYLELLKGNPEEIDALAKDLLINVTNFFRDRHVFDLLNDKVVPEMIKNAKPGVPLRIWSVGCSSGEEIYSLIMIFLEKIEESKRPIRLQVFASDIDPDAIQSAREGVYSSTIADDVSAERLARFFTIYENGFRVSQRMRDSVIFAVQDVLLDPPFSRIDLVSCRNVLIYLMPDAQAKAISLFEFSLNDRGILLLGNSETLGVIKDRFEPLFNKERIFRQKSGKVKRFPDASSITNRNLQPYQRTDIVRTPPRQMFLADLCRRLVLESFAPASVLINNKDQCIFTLGETKNYIHVVSGHPTNDIMAMVYDDVRSNLREAISLGATIKERVEHEGGRINREDKIISYYMTIQPVNHDGEQHLLISFIERPDADREQVSGPAHHDTSRVAELERELSAKKIEIATALYNIEILNESQLSISDEATSANEEFQATNEELLTSKEELQSLNEELSALNTQLHETLERQRRTENDLQNVLFSTNVATIFLDTNLNIRFFTPATRIVFNILKGDIGRPLSDLSPLSADEELLDDAKTVLADSSSIQKEIKGLKGKWFNRRVLPYLTSDNQVDGVVITYHDISHQIHIADTHETARHSAELSNSAKSSFLAAASHDLRQPLQTLLLLHGMLEPVVKDSNAKKLISRIGTTLSSMSSMLNSLLDINRIDAGIIPANKISFGIDDLLTRLGNEFSYHAEAKGLEMRVVSCHRHIISDPPLLEQILRNLLANAIKFTNKGKVLIGCRCHGNMLRIEIWDTGIGIPKNEIEMIFSEYHQLAESLTNTDRGLGLGLAIVDRLAHLLEHEIKVESLSGKGTMFAVEVELAAASADLSVVAPVEHNDPGGPEHAPPSYDIVLIDDEPDVLELLEHTLNDAGHTVRTARNSASLARILTASISPPDIIIADFNLADRSNGLQLALKFRQQFKHDMPIIVLTGDVSATTLKRITQENCLHIHKPVAPDRLKMIMCELIDKAEVWPESDKIPQSTDKVVINVVEDDSILRDKLSVELEQDDRIVKSYATSETFLEDFQPGGTQCLVLDAYLPGMSGLKLLQHMSDIGNRLPTIMITGLSDTQTAVDAMKAGAMDYIEKPIKIDTLRKSITKALEHSASGIEREKYLANVANCYKLLTPRQIEVMKLVLAGHPSKNIAADLGISQRTVENHRATVMKKTCSASLPALARFAVALTEINRE